MSTFALCVPFNCKYTIIILIQNIGRVFVSLPIRLSIALRIQKKKRIALHICIIRARRHKNAKSFKEH